MDALMSDTDADNGSAHQHIVSIHYIVKCGTAMLLHVIHSAHAHARTYKRSARKCLKGVHRQTLELIDARLR